MTTGTPSPYDPRRQQQGPGGRPDDGRPPRRRRSRIRSLLPLVVAAWAALEIWLLVLLAEAAGGLTVLAVLVAGFLLGTAVVKRAGRRAWRGLAESVQQMQQQMRDPAAHPGPPPAPQRRDGNGTAMLGGLLLMVPGLASDALGLLCVFPPTGALLRRAALRMAGRGNLGETFQQAHTAQEQVRIHRPDGRIVSGEVIRDDDPPGR
jgi:UPF0716 protein FxsA